MSILASGADKAGFYLLTCCVALAPIPFGSNSDGFAGLLGLALAAALLGTVAAPQPNLRGLRLCRTALLVAVVIAVWSGIQVVPWETPSWANSIWKQARPLIAEPHGAIAVSRVQPLYAAGYVLLPIAAFISALIYVRDGGRYITFVNIVLSVGFIVTVFCIGQYLYSPGALLWLEKQHYLGSFTGSFVNPNTAATYFGLVLLMALSTGLRHLERVNLLRLFQARRDLTGSDLLRWAYIAAYSLAAFVFFVALMLTQSRAGIVASMAGATCLIGAVGYFAIRRNTSLVAALGLTALFLSGAALLLGFYGGRLLRRLELEGLFDEQRACTFRSTWRAIVDNFWQGTGLGTFQDVFPHYRMPQCGLYGHWNAAHNLFLEGMLGLGVVVFSACSAAVYFQLIGTFAGGMRERRRLRFVPLVCFCILLTVTLHSMVDFSLQIPAVAVLVGAMLGAGAAISVGRSDWENRRAPHPLAAKPVNLPQTGPGKAL